MGEKQAGTFQCFPHHLVAVVGAGGQVKYSITPIAVVAALMLSFVGCATQDELRHVSRSLDAKITALQATVSGLQESLERTENRLEEMEESNASIRRSQADISADMTSVREELNRLRGAYEELQFKLEVGSTVTAAEDTASALENLEKRLRFVENKLDIAAVTEEPSRPVRPSAEPGKKSQPDSETLYSEAYKLFKEGDYEGSRKLFLEFLRLYPDAQYSDNARFWIGESYYFQGEYEKAILEYQKVIEEYPQGSRVPHALLKQALSFEKLGDKSSALLLLQRVTRDYPGTTAAETARSKLLELK